MNSLSARTAGTGGRGESMETGSEAYIQAVNLFSYTHSVKELPEFGLELKSSLKSATVINIEQ